MQVTLITTEGDIKKVNIKTFKDAKHFVSKDFYESPIEVLTMSDGRLMLLDEEGKLKGLEYNEEATRRAKDDNLIYPSDFIVGNVIIVDDVDEFDSLGYSE
jgi:hypothetical protein